MDENQPLLQLSVEPVSHTVEAHSELLMRRTIDRAWSLDVDFAMVW